MKLILLLIDDHTYNPVRKDLNILLLFMKVTECKVAIHHAKSIHSSSPKNISKFIEFVSVYVFIY